MFLQGIRKRKSRILGKEDKALPAATSTQRFSHHGRTSSHFSLKAGLTVETACVLPFFLWAVLGAFYLIEVSLIQTKLVGGIRDTSRQMALLAYGFYNEDAQGERGAGAIIEGIFSAAYAKSQILERAELEACTLKDEVWVTLAASDFSEEDIVDIRVTTSIQIPVPIYNIRKLRFMERGRVRAWTGRSPTEANGEDTEEEGEMVYVTATGTVYHTDAECTHIRLSVKSASAASMDSRRNTGGGKYYSCSCYEAHPSETVYYTTHGTRYHSSRSCSSLKRTVRKVELSSVSGLKPCSKCG